MLSDNPKIFADSGSFRDPAGVVYKINDSLNKTRIVRGVNKDVYINQMHFLESGIYDELENNKQIIKTSVLDKNHLPVSDIFKKWSGFLEHQNLEFISYPYEWSFSQLRDAALFHLDLLLILLEKGWIIKDSSPYNIQFLNNKPIFIDTPSIIKWEDGSGWDAYRQFCMLFLYPLMLTSYSGIEFRSLLRSNLNGVEPNYIFKVLGFRKLLKSGVISHVFLPNLIEQNILKKEKNTFRAKSRANIKHSKLSVIATVDSVKSIVSNLKINKVTTAWSDYENINTYEDNETIKKKSFIKEICLQNKIHTVWDMGANTGIFSYHIRNDVKKIIAMDSDSEAINKMYERLKLQETNIHPIVMKLENMSPNHGFGYMERVNLEKRAKPDLVMCLALIHHLRITENIPIENFITYLHTLNSNLIIEFVNRDDEMVMKLLLNKKEQYSDYNIENFVNISKKFFNIKKMLELKDGKRVLFFLKPKN